MGSEFARKARPQASAESSGHVTPSLSARSSRLVNDVLRSPGQPLDSQTRAYMEPRFGHDFSKVRVHADAKAANAASSIESWAFMRKGWTTDSYTAEKPEEGLGPVSQTGLIPATAPAVNPPPPPHSPSPSCAITTKTLVSAPDGTADTRRQVGVNEQIEMTASASATWLASGGAVTPAKGTTVIWTAPAVGATCSLTATPATGNPCSVSMTVLPPRSRSLVKQSDRAYTAGLAGSGFVADVTIMPTNVSFTRIQVWEGAVNGVATGYHDTVLHWNGLPHPPTMPLVPNASNSGLRDTVGTNVPGSPGPFSRGTFSWPIPQLFRAAGSTGSGSVYSTAFHTQVMTGANGAEGTYKEGAVRGRVP
jgi:hypothetical protein